MHARPKLASGPRLTLDVLFLGASDGLVEEVDRLPLVTMPASVEGQGQQNWPSTCYRTGSGGTS